MDKLITEQKNISQKSYQYVHALKSRMPLRVRFVKSMKAGSYNSLFSDLLLCMEVGSS